MSLVKPINPTLQAAGLAGTSLLLGLLFDWLFYRHLPGLSVPIYVSAIAVGLVGLARYLKRPLPRAALWLMLPLGFFAAMVAVRASYLVTALNILACLGLLLLVARLTFRNDLFEFRLLDYAKLLLLPLAFLKPLGQTLTELLAFRSAVIKHPLAAQVTRGILLAVPLLIVFLALFASADLVFQGYVAHLITFRLSPDVVRHTLLIAFVSLGLVGAYTYCLRPSASQPAIPAPATSRLRLGQVEITILLGSVSALFMLFILIQLAYLFGGLANISGHGFTYAEYARKGFFELLAVAMLAFAMLWTADKTVAKTTSSHGLPFRLLSATLIAQVLLIMVSAFKRLYLYEQAFGFTTLRLYSHVFVVFLAVIFVLFLVKILTAQTESRFALPAVLTALAFLVAMNLLNPDAFIARQNLDRFHRTGKLDARYMSQLSDDAHPQLKTAASLTTGPTQQQLAGSLARRSASSDWRSWNLSRTQASR